MMQCDNCGMVQVYMLPNRAVITCHNEEDGILSSYDNGEMKQDLECKNCNLAYLQTVYWDKKMEFEISSVK